MNKISIIITFILLIILSMLVGCPAETDNNDSQKNDPTRTEISEPVIPIIDKLLRSHNYYGGNEIGKIKSVIVFEDNQYRLYEYSYPNGFDTVNCVGTASVVWYNSDTTVDAEIGGKVEIVIDDSSCDVKYYLKNDLGFESAYSKRETFKYHKKTPELRLLSEYVVYNASGIITHCEKISYDENDNIIEYWGLTEESDVSNFVNIADIFSDEITYSHIIYSYQNGKLAEENITEVHHHDSTDDGEPTHHKNRKRKLYYWNDILPEGIPAIVETYMIGEEDNETASADPVISTRAYYNLTYKKNDTYTVTCLTDGSEGDRLSVKEQTYTLDPIMNDGSYYLSAEFERRSYSGDWVPYYSFVETRLFLEDGNVPYYHTSMLINSTVYNYKDEE